MPKVYKKRIFLALLTVVIIVLTIVVLSLTLRGSPPVSLLKVTFLDVGKADSIVIQLPDQRTILIDAGNAADQETVVKYLQSRKISKIDFLIATHPHVDHIGGMAAVIKTFPIGLIMMPDVPMDQQAGSSEYLALTSAIQDKKYKVTSPEQGVYLIQLPDLNLQILSPGGTWDDLNNYSIVTRLTYGDVAFVFDGDAQWALELRILADGMNVQADVLKVGHHGSATSSSEFLEAVGAKTGVISTGLDGDTAREPDKKTLKRLKSYGVEVLRTDVLGNIVIESDGVEYWVVK